MNHSTLSKFFGAAAIALSLAVLPTTLPATAQNNAAPSNAAPSNAAQDFKSNNAPNVDTTPFQETKGKVDNYGWLGLIGLVGLLNLLRKPAQPTAYREPDVVSRTGDRS